MNLKGGSKMAEQIIKFKAIGDYNGHSVKTNKAVDLGFKFPYDEMTNYIKLIQLLNENVEIAVKMGDEKPMKLGTFMIKNIGIDHDGQGTVKFNSQLDFVEADALNKLVGERFNIMFKAVIDVEGEEADE
jgi:hypothetical protein